jgi:lysozyme
MQINARGLALIKEFESCRLRAYQDGGGVWTIGWGHTKGVRAGDTCTQEQADQWLAEDAAEHDITRFLDGAPTNENEFAAMSCLAFNIGLGGFKANGDPIPGFRHSTVLKRHKLGNHVGAAKAFVLWNKDNGKVVRGLTRRREAEAALYLEPVALVAPVEAPPAAETPQPVSDSQIAQPAPYGCLAGLLAIFGPQR